MAISFVGSVTGTNSIASMPAHQAGDLIIICAYRDGSTTNPTRPSGFTQIAAPDGTSSSSTIGYKIAASGSETSGTWTNATSVICHVYRSSTGSVFPGASNTNAGSSTTANYPALTLNNTSGTSWVMGFAGCNQTNMSLETPPSLMTNRCSVNDATDEAAGADTNGGVTSWSSTNVSAGGTSGPWTTAVIEIAESPIRYIGSATGTNSIASMPAHQAGDLLLFFAYRDGSATAPSLPSGYTSKGTVNSTGFDAAVVRVGYKIAASGSETSGTWTNATQLDCHVYRGVDQSTPLGTAFGSSSRTSQGSSTASYPTITLNVATGTSWVVGFCGADLATVATETPPAGMINRSSAAASSSELAGHDTNGGRASWVGQTVALGGSNYDWIAVVFEILAGVSEVTLTAGNSDQLNQSSSAAITQNHVVAAGNSNQVNSSSSGAISQIHVVSVGNPDQINESSSGLVSQIHVLAAGNLDQINESSGGTITQEQTLVVGGSDQQNSVSSASVSQSHIVVHGDSDQINSVTSSAITHIHVVTTDNVNQLNTATSEAITHIHVVTTDNVNQLNTATSEAITQIHSLASGGTHQINSITGEAINLVLMFVAGNVKQDNESSAQAVSQVHSLGYTGTYQINDIVSGIIAQIHSVLSGNTDQLNYSTAEALTQAHVVLAGAAEQSNMVSSEAIAQAHLVSAGNSVQTNESSSSALTQVHEVASSSSYQVNSITGDAINLVATFVSGNSHQINEIVSAAITQVQYLVSGSSEQINTIIESAITQVHELVVGSSEQSNIVSEDAIDVDYVLAETGTECTTTVTSDSITQVHSLNSGGSDQANLSSSGALSQDYVNILSESVSIVIDYLAAGIGINLNGNDVSIAISSGTPSITISLTGLSTQASMETIVCGTETGISGEQVGIAYDPITITNSILIESLNITTSLGEIISNLGKDLVGSAITAIQTGVITAYALNNYTTNKRSVKVTNDLSRGIVVRDNLDRSIAVTDNLNRTVTVTNNLDRTTTVVDT